MDIFSYLSSKGLTVTESGEELVITCPYCHKEEHLYISKTNGLWKCHRCSECGTFKKLQLALGDTNEIKFLENITNGTFKETINIDWERYKSCEELLMFDSTQMNWLTQERGLSVSTIGHFRLGLKKDKFSKENKKNVDWITVPLVQNDKIVNVKYRSGFGFNKDFAHIKGAHLPLFNHDNTQKNEPLIICEGEFDAMMLWQNGFKNVVTGGGAGTFKSEWYDFVQSLNAPIIYVILDNDIPGQIGAKELCKRLGDIARNVILPRGKDPCEYFITYKQTKDDLQLLLDKASLADLESVITVNNALDKLIEQYESELHNHEYILKTPWDNVNKLISNRFDVGELIVLSARAGVGKTTFALNIAYNLAKRHNIPVLFMCLEMRPERLVKKLCSIVTGVEDELLTKENYDNARSHFKDVPFYFSYFWDDVGMDKTEKVFTTARKRFGIRFAVFDNLHFLPRSATNVVAEIGILSKRFKKLAENLGIPILLIAQPRRIDKREEVSSEDLKDSSAIKADADKVMILHREPMKVPPPEIGRRTKQQSIIDNMVSELETSLHPLTLVKVDKSRYGAGGSTFLWYDGARSYYRYSTADEINSFKNLYQHKQQEESKERF